MIFKNLFTPPHPLWQCINAAVIAYSRLHLLWTIAIFIVMDVIITWTNNYATNEQTGIQTDERTVRVRFNM